MVKYETSAVTAKSGLSFVRDVIERSGNIFHKIEHENDLGIDAWIELIYDKTPSGKQIAVQIKSGNSFFDYNRERCHITIGTHRQYWEKYSIPVIGVVYSPELQKSFWINIKSYLKNYPSAKKIQFTISRANCLDHESMKTIFLQVINNKPPNLSLHDAINWLWSPKFDESAWGIRTLFQGYRIEIQIWEEFIRFFVEKPISEIPDVLIAYLADIPGHWDMLRSGSDLSNTTRSIASKLLNGFSMNEIIKLLHFIDKENVISRGSIGQSVEIILSSLPNIDSTLSEIIQDEGVELFYRECCAIIFTMHNQMQSIPLLQILANSGSQRCQWIIEDLEKFGGINPYQ